MEFKLYGAGRDRRGPTHARIDIVRAEPRQCKAMQGARQPARPANERVPPSAADVEHDVYLCGQSRTMIAARSLSSSDNYIC